MTSSEQATTLGNTWSRKPFSALAPLPPAKKRPSNPLEGEGVAPKTMRVLNRLVDTLKLAFKVDFAENRLERIGRAQARAQRLGCPTSIRLAGIDWAVHRTGGGGLEFRLENRDATLCLGDDEHGWSCTIEFHAVWLQTNGPYKALEVARGVARNLGTVTGERVRRCDLAVDVMGVDFAQSELENFVSRAHKRASYSTHAELSGFTFGKGQQMFRLYRKDKELEEKQDCEKLATVQAQWRSQGWDGESPVWRYELQARFKSLESLGAGTPKECFERLDAIWSYFVVEDEEPMPGESRAQGAWVRLVKPETATRKTRAKTDDRWKVLERICWNLRAVVWTVRRKAKRGGASLEHVRGAVLSYLGSMRKLTRVTWEDSKERFLEWMLELSDTICGQENADDFAERCNGALDRFGEVPCKT